MSHVEPANPKRWTLPGYWGFQIYMYSGQGMDNSHLVCTTTHWHWTLFLDTSTKTFLHEYKNDLRWLQEHVYLWVIDAWPGYDAYYASCILGFTPLGGVDLLRYQGNYSWVLCHQRLAMLLNIKNPALTTDKFPGTRMRVQIKTQALYTQVIVEPHRRVVRVCEWHPIR